MPGSTILKGSSRRTLINSVISVTGSAGVELGVFAVNGIARLTGLVSLVGSGSFRTQFGASSASFIVSSALTVNSGGGVLDFIAYGTHARLSFSQLASQSAASVIIQAEPTR